jgi:DNA-binding MarR family transcriptional regulator
LPLRLVPAIHRATHAVALMLEQSPDLGVSQAEAHVLAHLADGEATVAEIHRAFGHKRSTLTSILDRLETRGFITRVVSAEDRRSFIVGLTRQGSALAAKVYARLEGLEAHVRKGFGKADIEAFERIITTVADTAGGSAERARTSSGARRRI